MLTSTCTRQFHIYVTITSCVYTIVSSLCRCAVYLSLFPLPEAGHGDEEVGRLLVGLKLNHWQREGLPPSAHKTLFVCQQPTVGVERCVESSSLSLSFYVSIAGDVSGAAV